MEYSQQIGGFPLWTNISLISPTQQTQVSWATPGWRCSPGEAIPGHCHADSLRSGAGHVDHRPFGQGPWPRVVSRPCSWVESELRTTRSLSLLWWCPSTGRCSSTPTNSPRREECTTWKRHIFEPRFGNPKCRSSGPCTLAEHSWARCTDLRSMPLPSGHHTEENVDCQYCEDLVLQKPMVSMRSWCCC